jgi:hypothetical protein
MGVAMRKKQKPDLMMIGPCGEDRKNRGWFFLSFSRGPVNSSTLLLAALTCLQDKLARFAMRRPWSPWLSRMVDRLEVLAVALAEKSGVRS